MARERLRAWGSAGGIRDPSRAGDTRRVRGRSREAARSMLERAQARDPPLALRYPRGMADETSVSVGMNLTGLDVRLLLDALTRARKDYRLEDLIRTKVLVLQHPPELQAYVDQLARLEERLRSAGAAGTTVEDIYAPIVRTLLVAHRRALANEVEKRRKFTIHPDLHRQLDEELQPLDDLMTRPWFRQGKRAQTPKLSDYVSVGSLESDDVNAATYDEKFAILHAPTLFIPDLEEARERGELRDVSTAVVFLDIDKFKDVNTDHTEPVVDRQILPKFMRAVEAHVYMRGIAYRFGGDEYVLLLHNVSADEAVRSAEMLRSAIADLKFEMTPQVVLTVSVGVVSVPPGCHLTAYEILRKAAEAKQHAKNNGRNCVATYADAWFEDLKLPKRTMAFGDGSLV
jgi:diguanylate cyclase (GGDEF)-like protein